MSLKPYPVVFKDKWIEIQKTVSSVLTSKKITQKFWNERFSDIYALCVAHPEPLAERLYSETRSLLENHVRDLCVTVSAQQEENLLADYYIHWMQYSAGTKNLNALYSYLNNQYVQKSKMTEADITYGSLSIDDCHKLQEIGELGMEIWHKEMILPLKDRLVTLLLNCIQQDRKHMSTDSPTSTIKGIIASFIEVNMFKNKATLQLFETIFEGELLRETSSFYASEASTALQEYDISTYMDKVIMRLSEEQLRCTKFLPPSSHSRVEKKVQQKMIADYVSSLYGEAPAMVAAEKTKDIANMYALLKVIPSGLAKLVKLIQDHVKDKGLQAISLLKGDNIPSQFVENLLQVHQKYLLMVKSLFCDDQLFLSALDKAFEAVVNYRPKNSYRSPELLAKYCDTLLKKSTKGVSEGEIEEKLSDSIIIFKYIEDKDVFQKFYSRHLAKRLIQQQSQNMDTEEGMINRLKQACGYEYTSKLHRMFTDMSISADHNTKFQQYTTQQKIELGINFSVNILQAGAWPLGQTTLTSTFSVPHELEKSLQAFEVFYHKNFNGRKLTWLHHLCQGEMKVSFTKRTYLISMSSYQMAMLLMFEKVDSVTCSDLEKHTLLNRDQFVKFLQSLVESKILNAESEDLSGSTLLHLNPSYTNRRTKFKLIVTSSRDMVIKEEETTYVSVEEDRKIYLQAAIVRIMKARKRLKHSLLVQEVLSQSRGRFCPQVSLIKKCIEVLIDKQYIDRDSGDPDMYSYMA